MSLTLTKKHALTLLAIFTLALLLRLGVLYQLQGTDPLAVLLGDSKAYHEWALTLVQSGDWIGTQTFYQSPLYPYFLALIYKVTGPSLLAVRIIQSILGALACLALYQATRKLFNPKTALIAGLLLGLFPIAIFFDLIIQKSALDSFLLSLLLLAIANLWRPTPSHNAGGWTQDSGRLLLWSTLLGLSTGLFVLNRENALPIAFILPILLFFHLRKPSSTSSSPSPSPSPSPDPGLGTRDSRPLLPPSPDSGPLLPSPNPGLRTRDSGLLLLSYFAALTLILLPVALRNKHVGGEFHLTTSQLGPNLYIGNNPSANGTYIPLVFGRGDAQYERQDAIDLAQQATGRTLTPGEVSNYWRNQVFTYIKSHPLDWAKLMARKTALSINATELGDTEDLYTWREYSSLLSFLSLFHVGILIPLAGMGILLTWPHRRRLSPLYAITAVYLASIIAFYIFARYRYPAILMLLPFAAAAITWLLSAAAQRLRRPVSSSATSSPDARRRTQDAGRRTQDARPLLPSSRPWTQDAGLWTSLLLLALLANLPLIPVANLQSTSHANLGTYFATHNQPDKALPHLVAAIDLYPQFPDHYFNLALFYVNNNRPDLALPVLDEGLKQSPNHPQLQALRNHAASRVQSPPAH